MSFESEETIKSIINKRKIEYPIFHLAEKDMSRLKFGIRYLTIIIVESNGFITYCKKGGGSDEKETVEIIEKEVHPKIVYALDC